MKLGSNKLAKVTKKLTTAIKGKSVASNAVSPSANLGGNNWLTKGSENIAAEVASAKVQSSKKFAPELYLKDGESRTIRFRSNEPIGLFRQYSVRINGKWTRLTAPPAGSRDLMREAGLNAGLKALYEVIDRTGYTDKQGKKQKDVPRFFVASLRIHEQLETIRKKRGNLTTFDIEISRSGSSTSTTYVCLPELPSKFDTSKIPLLRKDAEKFYGPPSLEEQKAIMNHYSPEEQDN